MVGETLKEMPVAPQIRNGSTLVPLRFLAGAFGVKVSWVPATREILIKDNDSLISLRPNSNQAIVDGQLKTISTSPVIDKETTLVPLRFLAENMNCRVNFVPATKEIIIDRSLPPLKPNQKPVADFQIKNPTVAQGETVTYEDKSYDPDGDEIVERQWTEKEKAFFASGEYEVTLRVRDSRGAWSEPCTRTIRVTEEVKMDKLQYYLHHPVAGEPVDISHINVLNLKTAKTAVSMNREKIMVSNSPEVIKKEGVLYRGVLEGRNRLYYHHLNGSSQTKKIYLVAENVGEEPVKLTVMRRGMAGPGNPMAVGRAAAFRYLAYRPGSAQFFELQPGETIVINEKTGHVVTPGKAVHGVFDINAHDELTFSVIAVNEQGNINKYKELKVLPKDDRHIRGTFTRANRNVTSTWISGEEPVRLVIADGKEDTFLYGKDGSLVRENKGNYGLKYRITLKSKKRVGVLFNPRGGAFAGAGSWDGKAFYLPNKGILQPQTQAAVLGVLEPGKEKVFEFIPPAGSSLPVNLVLIPF